LKRAHRNVTEVNGYDMEAWSLLIREAQNRWIGDVRPFFEQLVTVFPTTGRYWKIYIEQEVILAEFITDFIMLNNFFFTLQLKARNLELVEKVRPNPFRNLNSLISLNSSCNLIVRLVYKMRGL
jgi:hypothetical protein